ncbi:hypothetical protein DT036_19080, partial [Bacillus velezensis]|nr:hypothetical protein [Bacillus velezensis]
MANSQLAPCALHRRKNDQNLIIFVKRKPNVRQSSFDDFPVGLALPLGPTPSGNFTNDFGRLAFTHLVKDL